MLQLQYFYPWVSSWQTPHISRRILITAAFLNKSFKTVHCVFEEIQSNEANMFARVQHACK